MALGFVRLFEGLATSTEGQAKGAAEASAPLITLSERGEPSARSLLEVLLSAAELSAEGSILGTLASAVFDLNAATPLQREAVAGSAVVSLSALLLHTPTIPELLEAHVLRRLQLVLAAKVASADAFVGMAAWRGVPRCFLCASNALQPKAGRQEEANKARARGKEFSSLQNALLADLAQHVAAGVSSAPSEALLRMQGFSLPQTPSREEAPREETERQHSAEKAVARHDKEVGSNRFRLFRLLVQTARDAGWAFSAYALFDQPLPPLFPERLCVEACDVSAPTFCLPFLRTVLRDEAQEEQPAASVARREEAVGATASGEDKAELRRLLLKGKSDALKRTCPPQAAYGLAVFLHHPHQSLRERVAMLVQVRQRAAQAFFAGLPTNNPRRRRRRPALVNCDSLAVRVRKDFGSRHRRRNSSR